MLGDEETKPTFHLYQLQIDPAKAGGDIQVLKKKLEAKGVTQEQLTYMADAVLESVAEMQAGK